MSQDPSLEKIASWLAKTSIADPIVALAVERSRLWDEAGAPEPIDSQKAAEAEAIDLRICSMVATSPAGILVQLRLAREYTETAWSDDREERLHASIVAGLEQYDAARKRNTNSVLTPTEGPVPGRVERKQRQENRCARIAALAQSGDEPADRALSLVVERFRLWEDCDRHYDSDDEDTWNALVDETGDASDALDDQIADAVATSPAGIIAQVELLAQDEQPLDDEIVERLAASITTGILAIADKRDRVGVLGTVETLLGKGDGDQFLAAEREVVEANRLAERATAENWTDEELKPINNQYDAATDIGGTEPQSLVAAIVKLRRLLDTGSSPLAGYDIEMDSLRQVVAFLERATGAAADQVPVEPEVIGFGEPEALSRDFTPIARCGRE